MEQIQFEADNGIGILRIDRPESLNALSSRMLQELAHFLLERAKRQEVRALIVTGSGDKAFIAGADIKEMEAMDSNASERFCNLGQQVTLLLEQAPFVTIAAVNGFCLGGGLELALACDFIYASESAVLGLPEVSLGLIPGFGGTQRLSRAVGTRMAKELITSGRRINAQEALRLGLVNRVCTKEDLLDSAIATCKDVLKNSFSAVLRAKEAIDSGHGLPLTEALKIERLAFRSCFGDLDHTEGMRAFMEKRVPAFR